MTDHQRKTIQIIIKGLDAKDKEMPLSNLEHIIRVILMELLMDDRD